MKGHELTTTVLLLLILVLAAYCAYVSTRVVVALQDVDRSVSRATDVGQGAIGLARRVLGI